MDIIKYSVAGVAGLSLFAASSAMAQSQLDIDLNNFVVSASSTSGGYTLDLSDDDNTEIENIRIDGMDAAGFADPFPDFDAGFMGELELSGDADSGTITGGFYELSDGQGNVFSFDNISGSYFDSGTGIGVVLNKMSGTGSFNSDTFAGVDVSGFTADNLPTSAITFFLNPEVLTGGTTDTTVDTDITVTIPSPTAATAGLGLMGLMAAGKRRRK